MPNGYGKNWCRFCATIEGFCARYSRWPNKVKIPEWLNQDLCRILTAQEYGKVCSKIRIITGGESLIAADDSGVSYDYSEHSLPDKRMSAEEWLEVFPDMD